MSLTADEDPLADCPPSAQLVYLILRDADEESLCVADVRDRARLPESTTRYALERLVEAGAVAKKHDLGDTRRRRYRARTGRADARNR